jgi:serine/threonine protein kinase
MCGADSYHLLECHRPRAFSTLTSTIHLRPGRPFGKKAVSRYGSAVPDMIDGVIAARYRLVSLIGEGAMGRVWAARDELLGRDVAVKELTPPAGMAEAGRAERRTRVISEARAIARLDHPNIVRVHDVLHQRGEPWIVMELVAGRSLADAIGTDGPMAPERVAEIGLAVLGALCAAHAAGVLHRDVKPANVLLARDGRVVLTDFGLAKADGDSSMTNPSAVLGSPAYLAPERALDQPLGPAADLWSLGATLYAAVEGQPPYAKSSSIATLAALAAESPRPPVLAGPLRPALEALLQKDPELRADAATAERLLRAAASPRPTLVEPGPLGQPEPLASASAGRWRPWHIAAATAAVIVVALAAVFFVRAGTPPSSVTAAQASASPPAGRQPQAVRPAATTAVPAPPAVSVPEPGSTKKSSATPQESTVTKPAADVTTTAPSASSAPAVTGKRIENMRTGTCLQVADTEVHLWECNGSDGQLFTLAGDKTLRVRGRCVQASGTGDGAGLVAVTCTGSSAQQFAYEAAFDLVSLSANKCVGVPDGNSANGVAAQLWECTGEGAQKWHF